MVLLAIARTLRRFRRARSGAAAVEFALISVPFIWLTMGMAEVTMIGFGQTTLDFAMSEMARRIRTGQVQLEGTSETQFKGDICNELNGLLTMDCNNLFLDVDAYDAFIDVQNPNPVNSAGTLQQGQFGFNPGTSSQIVLVRGFYRWQILTPLFQGLFSNVGNEDRLLTSTILFRNEPF